MSSKDTIDDLLSDLARRKDSSTVNNFYNQSKVSNRTNLDNLKKYLAYYSKHSPKIILIGEAPGHKGCAKSGIPFTSQHVINSSKFFCNNQQEIIGGEQKENTATIMWQLFDELEQYPLLWNAFPFHPHDTNDKNSNRKPNKEELTEGLHYIKIFQSMFPKATLVAVGNVAQESLSSLGLTVQKVRHPSYGGKVAFIRDVTKLLQS